MITLNIAVSVAVVMLDDIRTVTIKEKRYQLHVDLPFFCVVFLGQPSKPALEVIPASPRITRLTLVVLSNDGQPISRWTEEVSRDPPGRNF